MYNKSFVIMRLLTLAIARIHPLPEASPCAPAPVTLETYSFATESVLPRSSARDPFSLIFTITLSFPP
jgi:hypothetical protein